MSTKWKWMDIALALIAILVIAVWGIAQTYENEKEQSKTEKNEEGLFYYFSTDANFERFAKTRTDEFNKARSEYFETCENNAFGHLQSFYFYQKT